MNGVLSKFRRFGIAMTAVLLLMGMTAAAQDSHRLDVTVSLGDNPTVDASGLATV